MKKMNVNAFLKALLLSLCLAGVFSGTGAAQERRPGGSTGGGTSGGGTGSGGGHRAEQNEARERDSARMEDHESTFGRDRSERERERALERERRENAWEREHSHRESGEKATGSAERLTRDRVFRESKEPKEREFRDNRP